MSSILYVEDEEDYQILVQHILKRAGLEVRVATTGAEGLTALRAERPSLLILDINLPDTDGYSICQELRQDPAWADLPILMLTVRRRPEEWLRGFASGADDYISKPLNPPELVERVVSCLEGRARRLKESSAPEYQLIQSAVQGNRAAFEVLIEKYRARLLDNLRQNTPDPVEAEEVIAQAFGKAFEKLQTFRGEASFYTWLYRIAMNELTAIRRRDNGVSIDALSGNDEAQIPTPLMEPDVVERIEEDAAEARMRKVLARVPEPYREMLDLFFVQELSYDQISEKLHIPMGTVMSRLHKARQVLKTLWEKKTVPLA